MKYSKEIVDELKELKILCSFPEDFILNGRIREQVDRLGNSVMPKQMYHIAKTLKEKILNGQNRET